jgi:aryl-alcohol dehydrogenase-like predicted oxidoreductase
MEYTTLGNTGMKVSEICLGCMAFGQRSSDKYNWSLNEEQSTEIIERAIDLGINFFDTANTYSWGDSERVLGSVLSEYDRDELVVASKVYNEPEKDPHQNATGLSRKAIEQELENSLDRLGMDTIDLYQTHRWDYSTPIEETLRALSDTIDRGQVRYIGASSMWTHQFSKAISTADLQGLDRFVTMQNHYNLVYREEEREMLPYCQGKEIGVIPWSPLARGYLTRPHQEFETTDRSETEINRTDGRHNIYRNGGGREINARVEELAEEKGVKMAQIALAWHFNKEWVDAPIIGTTSVEHLEDAVDAVDIRLTQSDVEYLEEPYEPVRITGHQ